MTRRDEEREEGLAGLLARREQKASSFYRALHGIELPGLPRFHLDRYGPCWVATFQLEPRGGPDLEAVVALLARSAEGVVLRFRDETRKGKNFAQVAAGSCPDRLVVEHAGYRFEALPTDPIDPGAYPDTEPLREALSREAAGKRVLNLFAFTCLNSVVARLAGARSVINVDLARSHLQRGRRNHELNSLRCDDRDFVAEDALLYGTKATPASFDIIIVDPPPLLRTGRGRVPSEERLEETLATVLRLAAPGATIHFLQCTARLGPDELLLRVRAACPGASVSVVTAVRGDLDPRELAPAFKDAVIRLATD